MTKKSKRKKTRKKKSQYQKKPEQRQIKPKHLIDIVMPIFGEFALAARAIKRVQAACAPLQGHEYRLIVVDNGTPDWISQDEQKKITPETMAEPIIEQIRGQDLFYRLEQNIGYPGGVNDAVSKGRSPLILILTADVFMEPGSINEMVRAMDNGDLGVCGPKLLFPTEIESPHGPGGTIQHAGLAFNIQGKPYHVFIGWSADHPKANIRRDVAAVTGACFMTRRNLWNQIGGFDTRYGLGTFEDLDYCFAIRSGGKGVYYIPEAVGYHLVNGARLQGANQSGFNLPMNEVIFRGKWAHMLAWDEWRYL